MKTWYQQGTITVTQGSADIVGDGTQWRKDIYGIGRGHAIIIRTSTGDRIYEIDRVVDDTHIIISDNMKEPTVSGLSYKIVNFMPSTLPDFGRKLAAQLSDYQTFFDSFQQLATGTGNVTLTAPDGQIVTVRSQQAWDSALNGKANSSDVFLLKGSLGTNDLNNVLGTDYQGIWWQNATANATVARNYPIVSAGNLLVIYNSVASYGITQIYITHVSKRIFIRSKPTASDAWTTWSEFWTSDNLVKQTNAFDATAGRIALNNAWGWGDSGQLVASENFSSILSSFNAQVIKSSATAVGFPTVAAAWTGLHIPFDGNAAVSLAILPTADITQTRVAVHTRRSASNVGWTELWTNRNLIKQDNFSDFALGKVLLAGAGGLGSSPINSDNMYAPESADANTLIRSGFSRSSGSSSANFFDNQMPLISAARPGGDGTGQVMQLQVSGAGELGFRRRFSGEWTAWRTAVNVEQSQTITGAKRFTSAINCLATNPTVGLEASGVTEATVGRWMQITNNGGALRAYIRAGSAGAPISAGERVITIPTAATGTALVTGNNAVADSNGFWKTASPVVKLFANGTSELTSEAEGITTERLSEGVYRISGCVGLNADRAWGGDDGGIDVPMCRNKLPRLWVDYGGDEGSAQINPDGSIVIRTYHRPHPDAPVFARNEIEGYANGDPIDIPHDTFISVRVQMPAVEAQETVVETVPNAVESDVVLETSTPV